MTWKKSFKLLKGLSPVLVVLTFREQYITAGAALTTKRLFPLLPRNGFFLSSTKQIGTKWLYWVARKGVANKRSFLNRYKIDYHGTKKIFTGHETSCHNTSFLARHWTSLPRNGIFLTRLETSCQEKNYLNAERKDLEPLIQIGFKPDANSTNTIKITSHEETLL